jgi:hypothetical protein
VVPARVVSLRCLHPLSASRCGARASYSVWCLSCSVLWRDVSRVVTAHGSCCAGVAVSVALQGLPLRETLQILYKIRRDKFLLEMFIFLVYFFVFIFVVLEVAWSLRDVGSGATHSPAHTVSHTHDSHTHTFVFVSPRRSFLFRRVALSLCCRHTQSPWHSGRMMASPRCVAVAVDARCLV